MSVVTSTEKAGKRGLARIPSLLKVLKRIKRKDARACARASGEVNFLARSRAVGGRRLNSKGRRIHAFGSPEEKREFPEKYNLEKIIIITETNRFGVDLTITVVHGL